MKIVYLFFSVAFLMSCSSEPTTDQTTEKILETEQSVSPQTDSNSDENLQSEPLTETIAEKSKEGKDKIAQVIPPEVVKKVDKGWEPNDIIDSDIEIEPVKEAPQMAKPDFSGVFNSILKSFVSSSGKVNYAAIKTSRELLGQATQYFEENPPQSSWSSNKKLAYWINAYNLYTIELVVDNYPVKSIKDIAGGKPWDKKFIKLAGRTLSLNDIENGIIRKDFNEPRIHFAVNCASISCPKLLNKEYTASNLNILLEAQTKRFINDNAMNLITEKKIEISNIFDWYKADFSNVIGFLNKYSTTQIDPSAKVSFKDYNWNLNN